MLRILFLSVAVLLFYIPGYTQDISWLPLSGPSGGPVSEVFVDSQGTMYATSSSGIYTFNVETSQWENITITISPGPIRSFTIGSEGSLFIVTESSNSELSGNVFQSLDRGDTWSPLDVGMLSGTRFTTITSGPEGQVWLTSEEDIFYSMNNGLSWQTQCANCFFQPAIMLETTAGDLFMNPPFQGISRSHDKGKTWETFRSGLPEFLNFFGVYTLIELDSGDLLAGTSHGVYKSTDNGETWALTIEGLPREGLNNPMVNALLQISGGQLIAGFNTRTVEPIYSLYTSSDDGQNWNLIQTDLLTPGAPGHINALHNFDEGVLVASTERGIFESRDQGLSWTSRHEGILSLTTTALAINHDDVLFAGTAASGIYRSSNLGTTWTQLNTGLPGPSISHLAFHKSGVLMAVFDDKGLFSSDDLGESWVSLNQNIVPGLPQLDIRSFSLSEDILFVAVQEPQQSYLSEDLGQTWQPTPDGLSPVGGVLSTYHQQLLAIGGGGMIRSEDGGNSWVRSNSGMGLATVVATGKSEAGDVFVATRNKGVFWSSDNGTLWNTAAFPSTFIESMIVSPRGRIFVSTQDSVFMSPDRGASWDPLTRGLREFEIHRMALDSRGFLYAAGPGTGIIRTSSSVLASPVSHGTPEPSITETLHGNYPDPFKTATQIVYELTRPSHVELSIFNLHGQRIAVVENAYKPAGKHTVSFDGSRLNAGMYFYRLETDTNEYIQSMIRIR